MRTASRRVARGRSTVELDQRSGLDGPMFIGRAAQTESLGVTLALGPADARRQATRG